MRLGRTWFPEAAASSLIRAAASAGEVRCPQTPTRPSVQLPPKFPISVNFAEFQRELLTRGGVEMPRFYAAAGQHCKRSTTGVKTQPSPAQPSKSNRQSVASGRVTIPLAVQVLACTLAYG